MSISLTNGKRLDFYTLTGRVMSANKNYESRMQANTTVSSRGGTIHGSNGYVSGYIAPSHHNVSVNSETIEHQEIFLEDEHGQQHAIQIRNWGVSCAPGHEMTFVWAVVLGQSSGPYLHITNHTTRQEYRSEQSIINLVQTKNYQLWNPFLLSMVVVPGIVWFNYGMWVGLLSMVVYWGVWFAPTPHLVERVFGDAQTDYADVKRVIDALLQEAVPKEQSAVHREIGHA